MKTVISAIGSKKLMICGVILGFIVEDAMAKGWSPAHLISAAVVTFGYCLAQGIADGLVALGNRK